MEAQLQALIDKIKNDGVVEAEKKANIITTGAEAKADKAINDAKTKATQIIEKAKDEAAKTKIAGTKALEQAGRNLLLSLQKDIIDLFNRILKREIGESLTPEVLSAILLKIVANWDRDADSGQELEVLLGKEDADNLINGMLSEIEKEARKGIYLKPVASVDAGFRIGEKDGNMHYDFTEKGLTEMLSQYLNPRLAEILKNTEK